MFSLWRNKRWPIALDIGTDSVKMLQMQKVGGAVGVCACARWRFPESARTDPAQRRRLAVEAVRSMLRENDFRGRKVVSSLSCSQISIKNVRLPHMSDDELVRAIQHEAKDRFSFEVSPDQLGYLNAGQVRQGTESRDEIILMAAPREVVEDHLGMLSEMGLAAEHVEAEPVAVFRVFERFLRRKADEQAVSVVVDIGHSATRVVVARGRQIVFIKCIDIAGRRLTEAVAKQLNLSFEEARDLRVRAMRGRPEDASTPAPETGAPASGDDPNSLNWTIHDAIRSETDALSREIALCLRYCSVTFRGLRPDRVNLTGGEAYDPALVQLLGEQLGVECVVAQPLRGIDVSPVQFGGDRRGMLAEWAVCAGLGMRNIGLPPNAQEEENGQGRLSA